MSPNLMNKLTLNHPEKMLHINKSWFKTAFITDCRHLPRCDLENVITITITENVFNATHVATLGAIISLEFFKLSEVYLEITLLSVVYCDIPDIPHGRVSWQENQCMSGTCRYTPSRTGFGEIYITCDPGYHLSGYGQLLCAGYNRFRTPIPTCQGKIFKFLRMTSQLDVLFYVIWFDIPHYPKFTLTFNSKILPLNE